MSQTNQDQLYEWRNPMGIRVAQMLSTGQPMDDVSFGIETPKAGWIFFHLMLGSAGKFACRVSGLPNDFLLDLVDGLTRLAAGESVSIAMHSEPDTFVMHIDQPRTGPVSFQIVHHPSYEARDRAEPVVSFALPDAAGLIGSLIHMLNDFMANTADDMYVAQMGHELPRARLRALRRSWEAPRV